MNTRNALLAIALAFGIWEATDIPDTGAPAIVFCIAFLACAAWLWRRRTSIGAPIVIALLCTVEASQAHTWKDASAAAKVAAEVLGTAGIAAAALVLVQRLRTARLRGGDA
jgi:hypothetical protein